MRELATRLAMTGTEVDRVHDHGVGDGGANFVVGHVLSAEQHPDADRLQRLHASTSATASRSRSSAARRTSPPGQTVAVARPGAVMPDGTKLGAAKLRGDRLQRDDPRRGRARDRHRPRRDPRARRPTLAPGHAAGRRARRSATTCSSSRSRRTGPTASASTASRARCTRRPARRSRPPPWDDDIGAGDAPPPPGIEVVVEDAELCPRFTARVFEDVTIGPSPPWLKARLIGRRPAPDLERRRHHELRDAADRPAAARLRPRPHRRRRGSSCAAARDGETMTTLDGQERRARPRHRA